MLRPDAVGPALVRAGGGTTPQGSGCSRISNGAMVLNTALDGRPNPAPSRHVQPAGPWCSGTTPLVLRLSGRGVARRHRARAARASPSALRFLTPRSTDARTLYRRATYSRQGRGTQVFCGTSHPELWHGRGRSGRYPFVRPSSAVNQCCGADGDARAAQRDGDCSDRDGGTKKPPELTLRRLLVSGRLRPCCWQRSPSSPDSRTRPCTSDGRCGSRCSRRAPTDRR